MRARWLAGLRRIERHVKSSLIRLLVSLMRPIGSRELPKWDSGPHRILFLRYDRIGDMLLATGVIKGIASAQPSITVDVLASAVNATVLRGNPYVGSIFTVDKKQPWTFLAAVWRIRRVRYAAVVDPAVLAPSLTSLVFMWTSGARHRIGISGRGIESAFTLPVHIVRGAVHYIDRSAALLAAFGVELRGAPPCPPMGRGIWRPEIFLTAAEREYGEYRWRTVTDMLRLVVGPRLVVNVSASSRERYWPEECFSETLVRIHARFPGLVAVIVGSPQDIGRMARIGRSARVTVAYTPSLRQVMAIVAASDLVLTADTAVTHIASAFAKPSLVMFVGGGGPIYGPYGTYGHVISTGGSSLDSMEIDPVIEALETLIAQAPRSATNYLRRPSPRS